MVLELNGYNSTVFGTTVIAAAPHSCPKKGTIADTEISNHEHCSELSKLLLAELMAARRQCVELQYLHPHALLLKLAGIASKSGTNSTTALYGNCPGFNSSALRRMW
jgi:hypothetical protein